MRILIGILLKFQTGFYENLLHDAVKLFVDNLHVSDVENFPVNLSCESDQVWLRGHKLINLMRSSNVRKSFPISFTLGLSKKIR